MHSTPATPSRSTRPSFRAILPDLVLLPSVALLLSFVMTWANTGFSEPFLASWGRNFLTSLVVLPLVLVCLGAIDKLVDKVLASAHWVTRKLVVAAITACVIETVISLAVTAASNPWDASFGPYWWLAFSRALPVGLLLSLFMCFYMKPRMDRMRQAARAAQSA